MNFIAITGLYRYNQWKDNTSICFMRAWSILFTRVILDLSSVWYRKSEFLNNGEFFLTFIFYMIIKLIFIILDLFKIEAEMLYNKSIYEMINISRPDDALWAYLIDLTSTLSVFTVKEIIFVGLWSVLMFCNRSFLYRKPLSINLGTFRCLRKLFFFITIMSAHERTYSAIMILVSLVVEDLDT